jgi:hypothetical protein
MIDYYPYIDFNSIKLGELAESLLDYKCAIKSYSKALDRLCNYPGDRMQPMLMGKDLAERIDKAKKALPLGTSVLKFESWKLSKSSFVKGSQCHKYLFLDKYKKQEKTPISEEKKELFARGHLFEDRVRSRDFPNGINVKDVVGDFVYFNLYTSYLLQDNNEQLIYEATIIEDDVLVMCDILKKDVSGNIDIYEIKLNKEINQAIFQDLAIQYYVCSKRFGYNLNSFNVIFSKGESSDNWVIKNLLDELEDHVEETVRRLEMFKEILQNDEPEIAMGEHCRKPYECEFIDYCKNKS